MGRYYGDSGYQFGIRISYAVKRLIIANAIVFLLQHIFFILFEIHPVWGTDYLTAFAGLNPELVLRGMIWQPVTYMFLHGGLFHLLINMLMLWMF